MANCAVCREDIEPGGRCPRCGSQNKGLEDVSFVYFTSFWGVLSILASFPLIFMLLPGIFGRVDAGMQPIVSLRIGGPIALISTLLISFSVFSLRETLYYYSLTRQFQRRPVRSLAFWALVCFGIAVLLTFFLGFVLTAKDLIVGPPGLGLVGARAIVAYGSTGHLVLKLVMTFCFVCVFAFFGLSASLMAALEYAKYLDEHRPDPIFMNERLLLNVVLAAVRHHLEIEGCLPPRRETSLRRAGSVMSAVDDGLRMSEMDRFEHGGISLTVHIEGELIGRGDIMVREDRTWYVEADRWGHLTKIDEKQLRLTQVVAEVSPQ
jgi:hypothetical protein